VHEERAVPGDVAGGLVDAQALGAAAVVLHREAEAGVELDGDVARGGRNGEGARKECGRKPQTDGLRAHVPFLLRFARGTTQPGAQFETALTRRTHIGWEMSSFPGVGALRKSPREAVTSPPGNTCKVYAENEPQLFR
jgi:hypothetical protein